MSRTYSALHYHLVFSTKDRTPVIAQAWRSRLWDYLGGTVQGLGGYSEGVGGVADHVHLLVGLRATHRLADFMRELKKASSVWVHQEMQNPHFQWQEGYGAFTVSPTARPQVQRYIDGQDEHHRTLSFREELKGLLLKAAVKFEDRYLD